MRILIWERGVGPDLPGPGLPRQQSQRPLMALPVGGYRIAPGGTQRVDWLEDGVHLTGWAEVILDGHWTRRL